MSMSASVYSNGSATPRANANGTSTPRDLNTRLRLLELYTLHVLPRNGEWDYAREFINMSEVLDDERKETFLLALHGLREEQQNSAIREAELQREQQEQLVKQRQQEEKQQIEAQLAEQERRRQEAGLGHPTRSSDDTSNHEYLNGYDPISGSPLNSSNRPKNILHSAKSASSAHLRPPRSKKAVRPPPGFFERASSVMSAMQTVLFSTTQSLRSNPLILLRVLLFIMAFAMAFGRKDVRERLKRLFAQVWEKLRRTVGMGVKVSYI
jgi:hypothetical protein